MAYLQDEAIKAVSAALSDVDGDLLGSIEALQQEWKHALSTTKATARDLLSNVLRERESLRTSLKTAAELWRILRPPEVVKSALTDFQEGSDGKAGFLANSEQIATVKALQNVSHSMFYLEFILAAPEALERTKKILAKLSEDGLEKVVPGNAAMLVDAHGILTAVERLRDLILQDSPHLEAGEFALPWFSEAEETRRSLEKIVLKDIFSNIVHISRQNPRLLVAAARIIQSEEAEDLWWQKHLKCGGHMELMATIRPGCGKEYRKRALDAVLGTLRRQFVDKEKELGIHRSSHKEEDRHLTANTIIFPIEIAGILEWIEGRRSENETVRRFVVPCLPPSFLISSLYEKELHRQFMRLITRLLHLVHRDGSMILSEEDLMMLTTWYCRYKEEVGEHDEAIDSFLSDKDRVRLISALQKHCASRISAKVAAAISGDRKRSNGSFNDYKSASNCSKSPNGNQTEADPGPSDLPDVVLGCINDEVRRMLSLKIQGMDQAIAETAANCLVSFQSKIQQAMKCEAEDSSEEEYRLYACATANNMARCLEYSEDLRDVFIPLASEMDRSDIEERMERVIEGFRSSASMALKVLIKGMDSSLRSHTERLFALHTGTEIMLDIIATLDDYFSDYQSHLLPYHFEHLAIESLKRVVVWYLAPFLRVARHDVEESGARRFTSLPNFDNMNGMNTSVLAEEVGNRSSLILVQKKMLVQNDMDGLRVLNGAAVVAQIDKDRANLSKFMTKKVVLYQKKQLQPTLEPLQAIRSLYTCPPTTFGLSDTFREAKAVINRALRPLWVADCGVCGHISYRVAEIIWESRKDVSPVVVVEAVSLIRSLGDSMESLSPPRDGKLTVFDESRAVESKTNLATEGMGTFPDRIGSGDPKNQDATKSSTCLLWAPSGSKSLRSKHRLRDFIG